MKGKKMRGWLLEKSRKNRKGCERKRKGYTWWERYGKNRKGMRQEAGPLF